MKNWLKIAAFLLLIFVHIGGLIFEVPRMPILNETIRSLYFHVPMWFGMTLFYILSIYYAIRYLKQPLQNFDVRSVEFANVGTAYGILGLLTGMVWANYTWGTPWHGDSKQNGAALTLLVYAAYFVLRGSLKNEEQKARLSAVYNIFAFAAMIPLIFIIPRLLSSTHPGSGGNPGFNAYDTDSKMLLVFYPAVIGWMLTGYWIATIRIRMRVFQDNLIELEND